ncbi:hypothetical protein [Cryobacterium sp. BB736]|uniref:hypothetical protein n=1 Tax=Cryobacterium sp. BB736 TaxID=2746963 RepID=UPI001873C63E|nr:hypothetical protein [Cryobacterium sp. BB736]
MTELADLLPHDRGSEFVAFRRGRVISVSGRRVKVDLGTLEITVPAADSCYPVPEQTVLLSVEGSTMTAIAALGGTNKQPTVIVSSSTSTTVTGTVNGVSRVMPKAGLFDVVAGDELPLFWAADGSTAWVGGKAGVPYIPPPEGGGGGGGGGGGTITTGTATYPVTGVGTYSNGTGSWISTSTVRQGSGISGAWFYGGSRFRELQGRTITGFRINISREAGGDTLNFYTHGHSSRPGGAPGLSNGPVGRGGSGWISLPTSMANWLISGSGTGGLAISGAPAGTLSSLGTLQFDWRR